MQLPDRVDWRWIDSLGAAQLIEAEGQLHARFAAEEAAEKERHGERYNMLRGPDSLVSAGLSWSLASNAARARGIVIGRRR